MKEKGIVILCGDLSVGQIYKSSGIELNMGKRSEFCKVNKEERTFQAERKSQLYSWRWDSTRYF